MKVAILGCGYVGRTVGRYWSRDCNFDVVATTTTPEKIPNLEAIGAIGTVLKGNDRPGLQKLLADREVLLLCLGASQSSYRETYLETANSLISILSENSSIRQIIYTGSYAVYGDRQGQKVDETADLHPQNEKEEILAETERVLLSASTSDRQVCIFRLGGIYGPDRELRKIFSRAAGKTLPGSGSEIGNWIHLDDIVRAIDFARQHQLQGIYNLVDDDRCLRRELIERVLSKHNLQPVIWDKLQTSTRSTNANVSNHKLKNVGYSFLHPYFFDRDV